MGVAEVIKEFNNNHGYCNADTMFVKRLRLLDLSEKQVAGVIVILDTICHDCMDAPEPCDCVKDACKGTCTS